MKTLVKITLLLLVFIIGGRFGPLLYPYKLYYSDTYYSLLLMRLRSLGVRYTYIGPHALEGYVGLAVILLLSVKFIKINSTAMLCVTSFVLGLYYDIMINGNVAGSLHVAFDEKFRNIVPVVIEYPLYLALPLFIMCIIPLVFVFFLSKISTIY